MKRFMALILLVSMLGGCAQEKQQEEAQITPTPVSTEQTEEKTDMTLKLKINETEVQVAWEDNASVDALKELAGNSPLEVRMSMYGGFEQVGSLGQSITRNDVQTVTDSGDIVLYSGNQIVVFYGSNSWAYTRLGHITDQDGNGMRSLLANGDVTLTLYMGE